MKATKSTVNYNGIEIEVYRLPNGEYHLNKNQVEKAIGKDHESLGKFLEAFPPKSFSCVQLQIESDNEPVSAVSLNVASVYWTYWASMGNVQAQSLVWFGMVR